MGFLRPVIYMTGMKILPFAKLRWPLMHRISYKALFGAVAIEPLKKHRQGVHRLRRQSLVRSNGKKEALEKRRPMGRSISTERGAELIRDPKGGPEDTAEARADAYCLPANFWRTLSRAEKAASPRRSLSRNGAGNAHVCHSSICLKPLRSKYGCGGLFLSN